MKTDRPAAKGDPKRASSIDAPADATIAHPVGTGVGAVAGGAAAGAAIGSVAGPVGTAVGAAAATLAGAFAGRKVAEAIEPNEDDDAYWREHHARQRYGAASSYDDYAPAYRYGADSSRRHRGRSFDEVEADLERGWDDAKGDSGLAWSDARHAARDAWLRVADLTERAAPGDADQDGR